MVHQLSLNKYLHPQTMNVHYHTGNVWHMPELTLQHSTQRERYQKT